LTDLGIWPIVGPQGSIMQEVIVIEAGRGERNYWLDPWSGDNASCRGIPSVRYKKQTVISCSRLSFGPLLTHWWSLQEYRRGPSFWRGWARLPTVWPIVRIWLARSTF